MKKKFHLLLRALCALLCLCLAAGAASPMAAAALTPEQKQNLDSGQRSLNNPKGAFKAPGAVSSFWWVHPGTWYAGEQLYNNIVEQFTTAQADPELWRDVFAYTPIIKKGDELPPRKDLNIVLDWLRVGETLESVLPYVLLEGIKDIYLAMQETDKPGEYQIIMLYSSRWGKSYWTPLNMYYDKSNGAVYGANGSGMMGMGINYVSARQMMTTAPYSYQRAVGFNGVYELIGPVVGFHTQTATFPFDYEGKEWKIQLWKGSYYYVSNGAEIGLYEREKGAQNLFDIWAPADRELGMSLKVYKDGKLDVEYPEEQNWWICGVHYGNPAKLPVVSADKLRMTGTVRFKDKVMLDAFLASFEANRPANLTGSAKGLLFSFDWLAG